MQPINGYTIVEQIGETPTSIVFRALKEGFDNTVVLKLLKARFPSSDNIARLKHEFAIIKGIQSDHIIQTYDMLNHGDGFVLVLEDFHSISLNRFLSLHSMFSIPSFLDIGVKICSALRDLHKINIIHQDIKPGNILFNPNDKCVKISDFGLATLTSGSDELNLRSFGVNGTLMYISPEQTGRMNLEVDHRSDLYSLGATFYHMLTGHPPFQFDDAAELIHAHIARNPASPTSIRSEIPDILSDIILKLLSKNPENRYQNVLGLKADLEKCLKRLSNTGEISTFRLGRKDISDKLTIPHRLIGREKEINQLLVEFKNIASAPPQSQNTGNAKMVLVSGEPGIGKSAIINELDKHISLNQGLSFSIKFDKSKSATPYSALIPTLRKMMRNILSQNDKIISKIKQNILSSIGKNGRLITTIIPELEKIIGPQPDVIELEPNEAKNRFTRTFEDFVELFIDTKIPTAIFYDDLQWADSASLQLIKKTLVRPQGRLLLIGTYRSSEVDASHPLHQMIDELKQGGIVPTHIRLTQLDLPHITTFLVHCLKCSKITGMELAEVVYDKTGGNPFFIRTFLYALKKNDLLKVDTKGKWNWEIEAIRQMNITDNVVELLSQKMAELSKPCQEIMKIGACIGNRFDLDMLSNVSEMELDELLSSLDEAMEEGFIGLAQNQYRFGHDRVREAAYATIPSSQKKQLHYKIGKISLLQNQGEVSADKVNFITDQLNLAMDVITDGDERKKLIQMNISCGKKAQNAAAFQPALHYFHAAIRNLDSDCWENEYGLSVLLYTHATEAAYLATDYQQMNRFAQVLITSANNILDTIPVNTTLIQSHSSQNNFTQAVKIALDVLEQLNFPIPENPGKLRIGVALFHIKSALSGDKIDKLMDLPEVKDGQLLAIFAMLSYLSRVSFNISPELFAYVTLKTIRLSLKHGNCKNNASAYMGLAILFISALNDIDTGYKLANISLELIKKYNAKSHETRTRTLYNMMVGHWKMTPRDLVVSYTQTYHLGLETGDLEFCANCLLLRDGLSLLMGGNLGDLERQVSQTSATIHDLNQLPTLNLNLIIWRSVLNFLNKDETNSEIPGDAPPNEDIIALWESENAGAYLGIYYVYKLLYQYYRGDYPAARGDFYAAGKYTQFLASMIPIKDYYFYGALTLLALYPEASPSEKRFTRKFVTLSLKKFKKWSLSAPKDTPDTSHRIKFIESEWARVSGKEIAAQKAYDLAIALAKENGHGAEAALINEHAGDFYDALGISKVAHACWSEAYDGYIIWGAILKQKQLQQAHPELLQSNNTTGNTEYDTTKVKAQATSGTSNQAIDLTTVIKASHAISGERELGKLLEKMMEITIENAGAEKGFMILENNQQFLVEAEKSIDEKEIRVLKSIPVQSHMGLSVSIVNYVARTQKTLILNDAFHEGEFTRDSYIQKNKPKSLLCAPIINQGRLLGMIYLENNLSAGAFTRDRMELINILSSQMAISIENAKFYQDLEEKVRERTLQLKSANDKLKNLSFIDPLTNLHNRRYLYEFVSEISDSFLKTLLRKLHKKDRRDQNPEDKIFGVYLLDIDHFKSVNDTYGHQAGDAVLVAFSKLLKSMIRSDDILVRWGGEEFLIVLQNITRDYLEIFPKRVINTVGETQLSLPNGQTITKTCSIGFAQMPFHFCQPDLLSLEQTINLSDYALYMAKENGRNQAVHIEINPGTRMGEQFKHYLYNLSKNSVLKQEFVRISHII